MDDPNPLRCVDSNHVPGCEHYPLEPPRTVSVQISGLSFPALEPIVDDGLAEALAAPGPADDIAAAVAPLVWGMKPVAIRAAGIFAAEPLPAGLDFDIHVTLTKAGRRRCPRCHLRRQLFRLTAFSADQPVGYGRSRCLECAGLRSTR